MSIDDEELYRSTFRQLLADPGPPASFPDRLAELGWGELADEAPAVAVGVLFEEHGRTLAATPALDVVVGRALGVDAAEVAVVHPRAAAPAGRADGTGGVVVDGIALAGAERAARFVVATADHAVVVAADGVGVTPVSGLDPTLGLSTVRGDGLHGDALRGEAATGATAAARRALGHELVGVAEALLAVASEQVIDRHQFGRPIATFQTVKHRLAEVRVAVEAAHGSLRAAWRAGDAHAALLAKAQAGRAALVAAKHCQQVCGAIGFTEEHRLPGLVRRAHVLDALYGSSAWAQEDLGRRLIETGSLPRGATRW